MTVKETIVARNLRGYYNEVCRVMKKLESESIDFAETQHSLIELDESYAEKIVQELES